MRCLVIADVHANLAAFQAVLRDAAPFEEIWCLGDLVGYGPDPNECIALLREWPHLAIAGNHDWAAVGKVDLEDFNPGARAAGEWTARQLKGENRRFLEGLALQQERGEFCLVHGSVRSPIWEYVDNTRVAAENLALQPTRYCLVGHTHTPVMYTESKGILSRTRTAHMRGERSAIVLDDRKAMLNPGSVGQPRDGDRRASYALLDPESGRVEVRRVEYPVADTQARMRSAGLPDRNALRLSLGR